MIFALFIGERVFPSKKPLKFPYHAIKCLPSGFIFQDIVHINICNVKSMWTTSSVYVLAF